MKTRGKGGVVVQIGASMAPRIEPAEGWQFRAKAGLMAFKDGEAGRLVSICDVFDWMKAARPAAEAMQQVLEGLRGLELGCIYQVASDAWALPVAADAVIFKERPPDGSPQAIYQANTGKWVDCFVNRCGMSAVLTVVERHLQARCGPASVAGRSVDVSRIVERMAGGVSVGNGPTIAAGVRVPSLAVTHTTANKVWGWGVAMHDVTQASREAKSPLDALPASARGALESEVEKWKAGRAASGAANGTRGATWPDLLRVAVADAVSALDRVQKGSGVGVVAAFMLVSEQAIRSQITDSRVTRSRAASQGPAGNLFSPAQEKR